MAYSQPWDESAPPGSAAANTLETIIQNKMIALRERLEQFVPDWADDSVDPKRILPSVVKVSKTTNQTVASLTFATVTWNVEVFDPDSTLAHPNGLYDAGVSTTDIVVIRDGYYFVSVMAELEGGGAGNNWTPAINKNGAAETPGVAIDASASNYLLSLNALSEANVGDVFTFSVTNNDGTNALDVIEAQMSVHMVNNL